MRWTFVLVVSTLGTGWLAYLVAKVRREIPPTQAAFDRLGRRIQPALVELRTQTARTRAETARLQRDI